jgi:hypothetical protein
MIQIKIRVANPGIDVSGDVLPTTLASFEALKKFLEQQGAPPSSIDRVLRRLEDPANHGETVAFL